MPIKKKSIKALRQTVARTEKNKKIKNEINDLKRKFKKLMEASKHSEAGEILLKLQKKMDKAVKTNVLKKGTVDRTKSRMQKAINKAMKK